MSHRRKGNLLSASVSDLPADLPEGIRAYVLALESEKETHHLRALLYQQLLDSASESVGEDLLKKIGTQPLGP